MTSLQPPTRANGLIDHSVRPCRIHDD